MLSQYYSDFVLDKEALKTGELIYYGELKVRPPGGTKRYPIQLAYPSATPFEAPKVTPLDQLPPLKNGGRTPEEPLKSLLFDHRHQMPAGDLCLFERDPRLLHGDAEIRGVDALRRAQAWFLGLDTGHWPPDTAESELESHFFACGDMLVSQVFYADEFRGSGKFYFVRDFWNRSVDLEESSFAPSIITCATEESQTPIRVFDARQDLSLAFPWIQNKAWDPAQAVGVDSERERRERQIDQGFWLSLKEEPRPFHQGKGLISELARQFDLSEEQAWLKISELLGVDVSTSVLHTVGLQFPARRGGVAWLFVAVLRGKRKNPDLIKTEEQKREEFEPSRVIGFRTHSIRPEVLQLRNTGVVADSVSNKVVALIGLGALGSEIAELLVKAGIGGFRLCDFDRLQTGNVVRHTGTLRDFGARKTRIIESRILEINPHIDLSKEHILPESIVDNLEKLQEFIKPADLVISTLADEAVESFLNEICVLSKKNVLYARALKKGDVGRVFLVRPTIDACKSCIEIHARSDEEPEPNSDWISVPESEDDILLHECGRPVIPASAADLSFVASLSARLAIDFLEGREIDQNHLLWTKNPESVKDSRIDHPFQVFLGNLAPVLTCPTCAEPEIDEVLISEAAYSLMKREVEEAQGKESCGILIGFNNSKRQSIVLEATPPGPEAEQSQDGCSRDVDFTQVMLEKAMKRLGEEGGYIGEWHSHLETNPQPSGIDLDSLIGITESLEYTTRCPIMLIWGVNEDGEPDHLKSWSFRLGRRVYEVSNRVVSDEDLDKMREP